MAVHIMKIHIRDENEQHFPGDIIDGFVSFIVREQIKIYTLTIGFYGTGKSTWIAIDGNEKKKVKGYEEYNSVFERIRNGDVIKYPEGVYKIPFRIKLKEHVPQTYNGCNSTIAYVLRAIMKTPCVGKYSSELIALTHEHPITIGVHRDLDKMLDRKGFPVCERRIHCKGVFKQELGCWFSTLGQILFEVYMSKQGYVPGQKMKMKINIFNHTTAFSCQLTVSMEQIIRNIHDNGAVQRTMSKVIILDIVQGDLLLAGQELEKVIKMKIPKHVDSSGCGESAVVNIEYQIKLEFMIFSETTGLKTKIVLIPIMIGDVRLDVNLWKEYRDKKGWDKPWDGNFTTYEKKKGLRELLHMKKVIRPSILNKTKLKRTRQVQRKLSMYLPDCPSHTPSRV